MSGTGAGGIGPIGSGGGLTDGLTIPILVSLMVVAGSGLLLLVARRRRRSDPEPGSAVPWAPEPLPPAPAGPAGPPLIGANDRYDAPDDVPADEANIPRWRRPSVQAARFAQPAPRRTVYESFTAENPGLGLTRSAGLTPIPGIDDIAFPPPPVSPFAPAAPAPASPKATTRASGQAAKAKARSRTGARPRTSPGSA